MFTESNVAIDMISNMIALATAQQLKAHVSISHAWAQAVEYNNQVKYLSQFIIDALREGNLQQAFLNSSIRLSIYL